VITVRAITPSDPLYAQEGVLRERVLLNSVGYDMEKFARDYPYEDQCEHFVAVTEHPVTGPTVLACALLLPGHPDASTGKVMQVAVNRQRQGEGIGRRLMVAVESRAFGQLGLGTLFCHAQLAAVPFYEKLGWVIEGGVFEEAGIDHYKMVLRGADLPPGPTGPALPDSPVPPGV
jgi:predicted GNAT family N-acyltransferase